LPIKQNWRIFCKPIVREATSLTAMCIFLINTCFPEQAANHDEKMTAYEWFKKIGPLKILGQGHQTTNMPLIYMHSPSNWSKLTLARTCFFEIKD
jgi:hypothetical protein